MANKHKGNKRTRPKTASAAARKAVSHGNPLASGQYAQRVVRNKKAYDRAKAKAAARAAE